MSERTRPVRTVAHALGLDCAIGGHNSLIVLSVLVLAEEETGRLYTLPALADATGIEPNQMMRQSLGVLAAAGYVSIEKAVSGADTPPGESEGPSTGWRTDGVLVANTHAGRLTLMRHFYALQQLPRSLQDHLRQRCGGGQT